MKCKILSLILVFAMTVSLFTVGAGAAELIYRDTDGHWAAETIEGFSRLGLIEGYNGQFFPNKNITRGEMAVILDRLMDYQTAAKNSFSDLGEAFYTDAVLKANAVGVMLGSNGTVRPTDPITRQEAAVLLCRALGLEGGGSVAQFSDRGQIASWAADAVGLMAAKGLIQGANGLFRPTEAITRAETVAILDRALGKLVSEGESASGRVDGNVVVRGAGAKLSDMTINGDLIIAEGVGVGEVHLNGVTITGRTIVRGGGVNSIYMNNVRANGGVVVNKLDGRVRVVTSGSTTVSVTLLQSGAILVGDGFKTVEIPADIAKGQTVEIQGNIERLVNSSEDAKITANGTIQTVEANVKTEIKGDAKVVGATGSADVKVNGSAVAKTDKPAAGGSSGGNSSTASKEITGAEKVTLKVGYGEKTADEALAALPTTVTLKLKDGKTISATVTEWKWASGVKYDSKPTADTPLTAEGSFTVPSGYTYSGSTTVQATVTVKALNKSKLEAAKDAYLDLQSKQTDDEKEAATDKTKILIKDSTPDQITAGVRFTTQKDWKPLEDTIRSIGI
ncbi:S-layer homology domain-containing protein [Intestinimonas sp. MSJ-38]|uniref:S-layer homology domain-containing protein n=1 Tax=Intestinimonas sp. MSJ-38 TaxID=2841532 RepID=UPI001C123F47|nr:S-layer homology domain-containing protein [Intestinimonas sp. MSJ-38]MBU5433929.1 S-layer homology domain-containing protein [Intestinimonas sp. MSJ-38]